MDAGEDSALAREVAGAIAWWREAGVDLCFDDEPARWISPAQPTAIEAARLRTQLRGAVPTRDDPRASHAGAPEASGNRRERAVDLAEFPPSLDLFGAWWLGEPSLDDGRSGGRVAPRGPAGAALMVIVPEPERDDDDRLLSGPQGRLLAGILASLGLEGDAVYIASALPRHMPMPDWPDLAARGFGELLARHVALAVPERLIVFGEGVLSLVDNSLTHKDADRDLFTHGERQVPLFRARSLDALLARPAWKAGLWHRMLDWMPPNAAGTADKGAG